jgi:predicted AlkP superfamily phosphohydrolase/phosphomutase
VEGESGAPRFTKLAFPAMMTTAPSYEIGSFQEAFYETTALTHLLGQRSNFVKRPFWEVIATQAHAIFAAR